MAKSHIFSMKLLFATVTATVVRAPPSSIQCRHDEGLVLDKVYFKRGDFIVLLDYARRLSSSLSFSGQVFASFYFRFQFQL
jgi:hypothetical protein